MKKEIIFGLFWGLTLGLLAAVLLFSTANSAVVPEDEGGVIEISISGDSVKVEIDKAGVVKSVTVLGDSLRRNQSGFAVDNDLLIQDGKIFIDGVELTEQELQKLSIDQNVGVSLGWRYHQKERHKEIKRRRLATVYRQSGQDLVKFGDLVVDSSTSISGDVVSISGDITVYGEVSGDVVSVFGNVYIKDGAHVYGDISAPLGEIVQGPNVTVRGKLEGHEKEKTSNIDFGLSARFNRVEGFTLISDLKYEDQKGQLPTVDINAAYAFTLKRWEYDFGIKHRFGNRIRPYFDLHLFQLAQSQDRWIFTETENSIAGLFFKEDFWDFYWSRGFDGEAGLYFSDKIHAGAIYHAAKISNLKRTAKKAIFGGDKKFRENWSTILPDSSDIFAMPGDLKEAGLKLAYGGEADETDSHSPYTTAEIEWRKTVDNSDFDYQVTTAEARTVQPIAANQFLILRARGGYSNDYLPLFRRFFLGGVGSLRGYDYKEFQGNRYLLMTGEYVWKFSKTSFGAGIFFDSGKAAFSDREFRTGGLKSDIGLSFLIEDFVRLDLAQRLDDLNRNPVVYGRLEMPF